MRGKAEREPARRKRAALQHGGLHISESTVTEFQFLPLVYFKGYFQGVGIAGCLLWQNEHHVVKFGENRFSRFCHNWSLRGMLKIKTVTSAKYNPFGSLCWAG